MVRPHSHFLGAQAVLNVISGERYKQVSDEIIQYAAGGWGREESESIHPDVRDKILSRPRARALAQMNYEQPTLGQLREQYGGPGVSDDDLLLHFFTSVDQVAQMRRERQHRQQGQGTQGLRTLIEKLASSRSVRYIQIRSGDNTLSMQA